MIKLIKEFIAFRQSLGSQSIDITPEMQRQLDAFDYSTAETLYNNTLDRLSKEMLRDNLSADYIRWAKFSLSHFKKHFK